MCRLVLSSENSVLSVTLGAIGSTRTWNATYFFKWRKEIKSEFQISIAHTTNDTYVYMLCESSCRLNAERKIGREEMSDSNHEERRRRGQRKRHEIRWKQNAPGIRTDGIQSWLRERPCVPYELILSPLVLSSCETIQRWTGWVRW